MRAFARLPGLFSFSLRLTAGVFSGSAFLLIAARPRPAACFSRGARPCGDRVFLIALPFVTLLTIQKTACYNSTLFGKHLVTGGINVFHWKKMIAVLCACVLVTACAGAFAEDYTASAPGMGGDVPVTVSYEDGRITAVTVGENNETPASVTRRSTPFPAASWRSRA